MIVVNIKKLAFLLISILSVLFINAQNIEFKNSNFKNDKEGLKLAKENIRIGDEYRAIAVEDMLNMRDAENLYNMALFYYNKAQIFNSNNADLNYKIGSSLLFTNNKEYAKSYLDKAYHLTDDLNDEFEFYYGMAFQLAGDYAKALSIYQSFKNKWCL